ncbi:MAG: tetratricopeptide repeat protein [Deltaproteobacteria bacterium]|nr:tetratricopeptide repeat protein [Deltaproteobacteria bacterium]
MSTTPRHDLERIGLRIAAEQDRALDGTPSPDADLLLAGVVTRRRRHARRRAAMVTIGGALVVLLGVLGAFRLAPRSELAQGGEARRAVAVTAAQPALGTTTAEEADVPLAFVDGTRVVVTRGATADLRDVQAHGATIALRDGTLDVDVVHTSESRWDVVAGGFDVHVTGTRFDATFDAKSGQLTVAMKQGSVRVTGPCVDEPLAAPATKTFACPSSLRAEPQTVTPESLPLARPSVPSPPVPSSRTPSGDPKGAPLAVAPPAPKPPGDDAVLEKGSAAEVLALGDEARLAGDAGRARAAYVRVRARFPRTEQAAKAAFLLGRMAEAGGALDEAVSDYAAATSESPGGTFAQDALGRTMEIEQRRGNGERARSLAEQYLRSFPSGPHASYARSIVDAAR